MLNTPNTERYRSQIEKMQDAVAQLGGQLQALQMFADVAIEEFNVDGAFSMQSCVDINPLQLEINKGIFDLSMRAGILRGDSWYFLNEGVNEGDSPPCDC